MAQLFAPPYQNAIDSNGLPISGGKLFFYVSGGLTPATVYTTSALNVAHATPVVADSAGRFPAIYLDPSIQYRVREFDANDILIRDTDPITASSGAESVNYSYDNASITQSLADVARRERLNLYDKIPRNLWAGIEAGTNTTDLTSYVQAALDTGRGVNVKAGTYRMKLNVTSQSIGQSLRGEGRHLTYFENVDNNPIITLDASAADIFGFELENAYLRNRDKVSFTTCDLIKITGTGNGEARQNDKHHFRNLWLFEGRDNFACYNRAIWLTLDNVMSTGALRDGIHVEVSANVNQWSLDDIVIRQAGRCGFFFKHDLTLAGPDLFTSLATGWAFENVSIEDCQYEGMRFTGTGGPQGFALQQCTFENNSLAVTAGTSPTVSGVLHRKANIHADSPYFVGFGIEGTTFYNGNGVTANNPDYHIYVDDTGSIEQSGAIDTCRFLTTQTGTDVLWERGLEYAASNVNSGLVTIDRLQGSVDEREALNPTAFTPALQFGGGATGMTTTNAVGRFLVRGREVSVQLYVSISAKGSSTGVATIAGLPFAALNVTNLPARLTVEGTGLQSTADTQLFARVLPGEQVVRLFRYEAGTEAALTDADFGANAAIGITGSYFL